MSANHLSDSDPITAAALSPGLWSRVEAILESRLRGGDISATVATELKTDAGCYLASFHELPAHDETPVLLVIAVEEDAAGLPGLARIQKRFGLTEREAEVALQLAERKRNSEIAQALFISEHTARRHTEKVLQKMGLNSRLDVRGELLSALPSGWADPVTASLSVA